MTTTEVRNVDPPRWVLEIVSLLFAVGMTMNVVFAFGREIAAVPAGVLVGVVVYSAFYRLFFVKE